MQTMRSLTAITTVFLLNHDAGYANAFLLPNTRISLLSRIDIRNANTYFISSSSPTTLHASTDSSNTTPPLPDTSDPFLILNLKQPTADKKVIKRAYKRMALQYHPDMRTNAKSTEKERKLANDDFARINAAYAFLTGKSDERPDATESEKKRGASRGSASSRSSSSNVYDRYGNTPPHRRTTDYSTDDWKDYMPKYDESYDTNGDSFGAIFSDLFSEIGSSGPGGLGGGAGILNDFMSFLEGNFPSVGSAQTTEEDMILDSLLKDGGLEEIKNELDDAKLLVRQLEAKEIDLDSELLTVVKEKEALGTGSSRTFMEEMSLEEKKREIEARKSVVGDFLERARLRQIKLRKRYEELRIEERSDTSYGRTSNRAYERSSRTDPVGNSGGTTGRGTTGETYSSRYASSQASSETETKPDDDAWKRESFGSSRRRGRGSRGRRSSSSNDTNASSSSSYSSSKSTNGTGASDRSTSSAHNSGSFGGSYDSSGPRSTRSNNTERSSSSSLSNNVPPHRRVTSSTFENRVAEDKRRLREIKVDEEIDKMKKELGL